MPKASRGARRERAVAQRRLAAYYGWPAPRRRRIDRVAAVLAVVALLAIVALVAGTVRW